MIIANKKYAILGKIAAKPSLLIKLIKIPVKNSMMIHFYYYRYNRLYQKYVILRLIIYNFVLIGMILISIVI